MPNMNFDIMKSNIRSLMSSRNMTQEALGKEISMSQSNVNKCLKLGDGSRSFTLEQVCKIADVFGTSVDDLLGRQEESKSYSAEAICRLFSSLIRNYQIVHFDHTVEEEVWVPFVNGYDPDISKKNVTYDAFYFPNYITPPEYFDDHRLWDLEDEARNAGNDLPGNISINNFLHRFLDAFEKYDSGDQNKDDFDILVNAYYQILKK